MPVPIKGPIKTRELRIYGTPNVKQFDSDTKITVLLLECVYFKRETVVYHSVVFLFIFSIFIILNENNTEFEIHGVIDLYKKFGKIVRPNLQSCRNSQLLNKSNWIAIENNYSKIYEFNSVFCSIFMYYFVST